MRKKAFGIIAVSILLALVITGCRVRSASQGDPKEPTLARDNLAANTSPTSEVLPTDDSVPTEEVLPSPSPTLFTLPTETPTLAETQVVAFPSDTPMGFIGTSESGSIPTQETGLVATTEVPAFPSDTPTIFPTDTPSPTPTITPSPTPTDTLIPSPTNTPTPEATSTFTPFPTLTPTGVSVAIQGTLVPQQATATAIILTFEASQGTYYPTEPVVIDPGATADLAGPTATPTLQPGTFPDCDYYIQPGDTLSNIGRTYNVSTDELAAYNTLTNPNFIKAGDTILIPGCGRNPTPVPTATPGGLTGGSSGVAANYDNSVGPIQYIVEQGDNIYRLSVKFGVTMRDILVANPRITDINAIFVGETLTIPARTQPVDSSTPAAAPTQNTVPAFPTATLAG